VADPHLPHLSVNALALLITMTGFDVPNKSYGRIEAEKDLVHGRPIVSVDNIKTRFGIVRFIAGFPVISQPSNDAAYCHQFSKAIPSARRRTKLRPCWNKWG